MDIPERWLFYALGGGMGHVARTAALARALCRRRSARRPIELTLLTNSPYARHISLATELDAAAKLCLEFVNADSDRSQVAARVTGLLASSAAGCACCRCLPAWSRR